MSKINKIAYLAGAMESLKDEGLSWRRKFSSALEKVGIKSVIPNDEEKDIKQKYNLAELKKTDIEKYVEIIRSFITMDLKFVETVDMLIVKWEGEVTTGTVHEVGYAFQLKKPCYLVTSKKLHEVSGWFLSCFTKVFPDLDCLIHYLKRE
jgi:nucleoside 2-deoxyribosyltransferase